MEVIKLGEKFNLNLKEARERAKLTQKEVADAIGVAYSTYSLYESGKREPNVITIKKIADTLNVSANVLLGIRDYDEPTQTNGESVYYTNEKTAKIAQEIFDNTDLRALFDATRDISPDDMRLIYDMALALKRKEDGDDDFGC